MGGRVAEELFMNHMTSGASNDIERATDIAQHMVCEWGMSELGPLAFRKPGNAFDADAPHAVSEATAQRVDEEIRKVVLHGYDRAREIIVDATASRCACWPRSCSSRSRSKPPRSGCSWRRRALGPNRARRSRSKPWNSLESGVNSNGAASYQVSAFSVRPNSIQLRADSRELWGRGS